MGMKTETMPVVIGALGLIKKGLQKHTEKIPGAININELQKITLLGTAHILRKATVLCKSNASEMREFLSLFLRLFDENSHESSSEISRRIER